MNKFLSFLLMCCLASASASDRPSEVKVRSGDGTLIKVWVMHPQGLSSETQTRPVVVALHGCGGMYATLGPRKGELNARHQGMSDLLLAQGYSVVWPDSFTDRGESSLCSQKYAQRKIKQSHRRDDVNGVLAWMSQQAWVDSRKTALLGWSHGGSAVLAATDKRVLSVQNRILQPDVAIAFYPGCAEALQSGYEPNVELMMLLAELDDWTPPGPCLALANRVQAKVNVYAKSYHDFDNPVGSVKLRTDVPNGLYPGQGVHVGRNPETGPQAWKDVTDFLAQRWASK